MVLTEGELQFTFPGEKAIKFDDTEFYRKRFNKLSGAKGVDFILLGIRKTVFEK